MNAIGYLRRPGKGAAALEAQAARLRGYCEVQGWTLAALVTEERSWWRKDLVGLADLVRGVEAHPGAERVLIPAETLAELEGAAPETWSKIRAWCEARGVRVVPVEGGA